MNRQLSPRSYEVTTRGGGRYRRNRQQIRASTPSWSPGNDSFHSDIQPALGNEIVPSSEPVGCRNNDETPMHGEYCTRSGRQVRAPIRLDI